MLDEHAAFREAPPEPSWPGFSVFGNGIWSHLRCDSCGKATSPASLNAPVIDDLVRIHRCGPPLSTHWSQAVSLGPGYAVAFISYAMHIEQMPYGCGAEPDVDAALDHIIEAAQSQRRAASGVAEQYQQHQRLQPVSPAGVVAERPFYDPEPTGLQQLSGEEAEAPGPVYITVGDLLRGCLLPSSPSTGMTAVGVVWAPGMLCLTHLAEQLEDGRLAEQLGPDEGGVVVYPGDSGPSCGQCERIEQVPETCPHGMVPAPAGPGCLRCLDPDGRSAE